MKIYTGHAWRDITEDAAAGDVYDEPPYSKEELEAVKLQVSLDDWDEYQRYHDSRDFETGDVYEGEAE